VEREAEEEDAEANFTQARFPTELNLPAGTDVNLDEARKAIRREYRDSSKWKRLRCRKVKEISESESGTIYELEIGHAVEFDWTWEGAVAFRPLLVKEFEEAQADLYQHGSLEPDVDDSIVWTGEVLEVDEATGRIFIVVSNPEYPPRCGSFYVRPFEFLAFLDAVFNEPSFDSVRQYLPARLSATTGGVHPDVVDPSDDGLEELRSWWGKSWSVLWGPPGTGKTYTTGQQVARILADPTERILVVSTTNRATDAVALSIGRAATKLGINLSTGLVRRIGKGASFKKYEEEDLTALLKGTETEYLAQIEKLATELARTQEPEAKAGLRLKIKEIREAMLDAAKRNFLDINVQAVVSTAFKASTFLNQDEVKDELSEGKCPFTTIFIDEAGLMSRVAIAALSLLASRRVVLVGDSKQLAPISRISRILEPSQGNWLGRSGLSHLDQIRKAIVGVHVLQEQRRMHADVCEVVSRFQYDGFLKTAADIANRQHTLPNLLQGQPRAIWYVLDQDVDELPSIRAERGPGNRSWVRTATSKVLKKLFTDPTLRTANGLFISPFKAQAKEIHAFFASNDMPTWTASTVHSQQGSEADIVIFDSVNAGSYGWAYDEWKRLVNVALSRSRESLIVLASRAEMDEPYLRPLLNQLAPRIAKKHGAQLSWEGVPAKANYRMPMVAESESPYLLGNQLSKRKELRPVLSNEQERLCGLELDGKPRLVRGVAGSGKTVILAHWLMQTVKRLSDRQSVRIWAVFANRSLQSLIGESIASAWEKEMDGQSFPWDRVELHHIREILEVLLPEAGLSADSFQFDYDQAAEAYLSRIPAGAIAPRCDALFIDEAQDMGPNTLKLLSSIVRRADASDENSRSINIFYDNAQNIYGRSTPKWSELGLDMRGRSTVMKESFRSTRPITEFALNVLYRLQPPDTSLDHKELVTRGLIERSSRNGTQWWNVRFNQIDGPKPEFYRYASLQQEFEAIGDYCRELICVQGVQPSDICLIYNGSNIPYWLQKSMMPRLEGMGIELSVQTNKPFERSSNMLLATTSHSFKGYDSEVVIIPGVDQYKAQGKGVLANNLYVAMTRARSVLALFSQRMNDLEAKKLYQVIEDCLGHLEEAPDVDSEISPQDDIVEILEHIGSEHRKWLMELWSKVRVAQEPLMTKTGEVIAEPLFSFRIGKQTYACFGSELPRKRILQRLEDFDVKPIVAGDRPVDTL
jgi:superfamily I DNA/RNA helicase